MNWLNHLMCDLRDALYKEGITACGCDPKAQPFNIGLSVPFEIDVQPWSKSQRFFEDSIRELVHALKTWCNGQVHQYRIRAEIDSTRCRYYVVLSVSRGSLPLTSDTVPAPQSAAEIMRQAGVPNMLEGRVLNLNPCRGCIPTGDDCKHCKSTESDRCRSCTCSGATCHTCENSEP